MKRSVLRIGCAVLSLSAAAGLLASCSLLPPASPLPDSKPAQAEEAPGPAAASLDDGKLRILYSNGSNGGNTVLCGSTVLYQAANSETVYLVPDTLTGTARYYMRQWSDPGAPTGRVCALYDRDGKEVLTFDRAYDAALTGTLLVLTTPEEFAYSPALHHAAGDCRVLDLATGEELTVPENTYGCRIAGETLAFNLCNAPAQALDENTWGDDLTRYYALQIQDRDGNRIRQEPELLLQRDLVPGRLAGTGLLLRRRGHGDRPYQPVQHRHRRGADRIPAVHRRGYGLPVQQRPISAGRSGQHRTKRGAL